MTRADLIRETPDEKLAKLLVRRVDPLWYKSGEPQCWIGDFSPPQDSEDKAIEKELEWLREEVQMKAILIIDRPDRCRDCRLRKPEISKNLCERKLHASFW